MSRPTPRRSSLAGSSPVQPPEQPATTPAAAESEKAKAATPKPPKQAAPALVIASTDAKGESRVVRQGIYITADEFADAKRAHLADWQAGGQADTFARWIGAVTDAHAARTAAERAELARPTGRSEHRTGASAAHDPHPHERVMPARRDCLTQGVASRAAKVANRRPASR